jgi:DNA topoisomerase VI subunit B
VANTTPSSRHRLSRQTFTTSRLLEFCSRKELELQTGHPADQWALVVAKDCGDNALDAAEEAGVTPDVTFTVSTDGPASITVTDNGPGISPETVRSILDFNVRVSSREAYTRPSRGAQGNAAKAVIAMPFALSDDHEEALKTIIESRGVRHEIGLSVDAVRQTPVITHERERSARKTGTSITVQWPVPVAQNWRSSASVSYKSCSATPF